MSTQDYLRKSCCLPISYCQNHPFIDGNKRAAAVSALMFHALNNQCIDYNEVELENLTHEVAEGKIKKKKIAAFFAKCLG
ncbi:MAG: type II toxin-antitoxin system death-on-curing family toxin [Verrucomicrobia bacterium]|nr:type II toxin-antitoxin system death-on-curing family toxin [Verrucomicrobiota bacterium]